MQTNTFPEWLSIKYLPILPPNLRPIIRLPDYTLITSDLNFLYSKIISTNNKILKLRKMLVPETFLGNEKIALQKNVDKLFSDTGSEKKIGLRNKDELNLLYTNKLVNEICINLFF